MHVRAPRLSDRHVPTILVMDDDLPVRRTLHRALRSRGWRVQCAASPEEALVLLGENVPDLLITDLSVGTVSGWDVLFHETLERPSLPIIAISALPADKVYGADHLARAYFQKPLDMDRLLEAARRCIDEAAVIRMII